MNVHTYDDLASMLRDLGPYIEAANARVRPAQRGITYGSYWMRMVRFGPGDRLLLAGHVHDWDEIVLAARASGLRGEDLRMTLVSVADRHDVGLRYGSAYSTLAPDGELGDTHIADMVPITRDQFEQLRSIGWDTEIFRYLVRSGEL